MKKWVVTLSICTLLACSMLTINVAASRPNVLLPTSTVTMNAVNGTTSYFDMTLPDVPAGFSITAGTYRAWCVEVLVKMTPHVNHQVHLYSSYDPAMPINFTSSKWDKINYIINNDAGKSRMSIQQVIWYFACNDPIAKNDSEAIAMRNDANNSGAGFVPSVGQKIAILVDVSKQNDGAISVQKTILELPLRPQAKLGDLVWKDVNGNGLQDAGEPGLSGVTVELYNATNVKVETTVTDSTGFYSFSNFTTANYSIQFKILTGYVFTKQNIGTDDTKDSDANRTTGRTQVFIPTINDTSWDAGMYIPSSNPDKPVTPPPVNRPPTADGTAGEPYTVFGDGTSKGIRFDGSRSYDVDGTIVSYVWNFGDGSTVNGIIVTHNYTALGKYNVTLTVTDNGGAKDTYKTIAHYRLSNRPPLPPTLTGSTEGHWNVPYSLSMVTTDPDGDGVRYIIAWGDESQNQNNDLFFPSGHNAQTSHQYATWGFYTIQVYAQDNSTDDKNNTSNVSEMKVAIDVQYVGSLGYLINTDSVGPFDAFHSNLTGTQTGAQRQKTGVYLIDTNGDGKNEYQFDPSTKTFREYNEGLSPFYTMLLIGLGVVILILLLLGFLVRRRQKKT